MKPISLVCILFLFAQQSIAQNSSATAFDKLKASYDAAFKPTDVASVLKRIATIKDCAGAASNDPDRMQRLMIPVKAVYTTDSFGPDFPSQTYTGIGFVDSRNTSFTAGENFFSDYNESFTKNSLKLKTKKYFIDSACDNDGNCWNYTDSWTVNAELKVSEKYIHYSSEPFYAYCW